MTDKEKIIAKELTGLLLEKDNDNGTFTNISEKK